MKKYLAVSVAIASMIGVSAVTPAYVQTFRVEAAGFDYTQEQEQALAHLNKIRADIGLQPVKLNPFLNKASENHVSYIVTNGIRITHEESKDKKGFTGATHTDRLKAVGAPEDVYATAGELVASQVSDVSKGIDTFMVLPYHRDKLIAPDLESVGFSLNKGIMVITTSGHDEYVNIQDSMYPYDGQTGVPTYFTDSMEDPNPLKAFGVSKTGTAITYKPITKYDVEKKDMNAKITDSKGNDVPFFLGGGAAFHFYPKNELKTNETYTVSVSYKDSYDGKTGSRTWSFTTASKSSGWLGGVSTPTPQPEPKPSEPQTGGYIDQYGNPVDSIGNSTPKTKDNGYSTTRPNDDVAIRLDGQFLTNLNPKPVIRNGSTLVPLRGVLEQMDAEVVWNQAKKEIIIRNPNTEIKLYLNQTYAYRDGKKVTLSQAPILIGSSTYVPLRFLSENLGATVGWDNKNRIVDITLN